MTIEEMQKKKRELGYTNEMIAEKSGVPLGTVQKIFAGITTAPRRFTLEALESVLRVPPPDKMPVIYAVGEEPPRNVLRETSSALPIEEWHTIDDYYALPDDRRVELIDGEFYDMAAPTQVHQTILLEMAFQLKPCVEEHEGCRIFIAPVDVRLDNDDYTMVQPDLLIVCGKNDGDIRRINGAPDFITEVLSPASRMHDMFRKLTKYRFAGVREYWIVDPDKERVTVYDLENGDLPETYDFSDTVPLGLSGGSCTVDFARIRNVLRRYAEI